MTLEEMKRLQRELQEQQQNGFINNLLDAVKNLCDKANKKDYIPTDHERRTFNEIYNIINNMSNWF